jgi:electron transfer flavoprotein beta subunit
MKVLVCVKQVLDPGGIIVNRKAEKVFINREEFILEPASKAALEAANDLKQAGTEVIAISVGPERVEDGLREALARGADRAIFRSEGGDALVSQFDRCSDEQDRRHRSDHRRPSIA